MSPLSLQRDLFITLDLKDFFSSPSAELCLSPTKLDGFPCSGILKSLSSICSLLSIFFVVETTKFYWPCEPSGDGADSCSKRSSPVNGTLYTHCISIVCQFHCIVLVCWDTCMHMISHYLKEIQTLCLCLQADHLCILKLNPHNSNQWRCTQCMWWQSFVYLHAW